MKKLRIFQCSDCLSKSERLVKDDVTILCCDCGGLFKRIMSSPRVLGNTTGKSPSFSNVK